MLFRFTLSYACAGVETNDKGIVVETAPIFNWMKGKHIYKCVRWIRKKNGKVYCYRKR